MNFAPYQSSPPESERAKSPPPLRSPTTSPTPQQQAARQKQQQQQHTRNTSSVSTSTDPWAAARNQSLPSPSQYQDEDEDEQRGFFYNDYVGSRALEGGGATVGGGHGGASVFETSLGLNLGVEACLAYVLLPPAGGVVLLLFEHKSDYVRFHAWQSALLFSALFLIHIIFSWTKIVSWTLFAFDILAIVYLAYGAWKNQDTLDRVEVPIFGRLASSFVDDE